MLEILYRYLDTSGKKGMYKINELNTHFKKLEKWQQTKLERWNNGRDKGDETRTLAMGRPCRA